MPISAGGNFLFLSADDSSSTVLDAAAPSGAAVTSAIESDSESSSP